MQKITLNEALRTQLNGLDANVELCDESGRTLGHFVPLAEYRKLLTAVAEGQCPYSEEELQKFEQQTDGRPLAEIWKSLGRS